MECIVTMGQTHALRQYTYANNLTPLSAFFLLSSFRSTSVFMFVFLQNASTVANGSVYSNTMQHEVQPTILANNNDAVFQGS